MELVRMGGSGTMSFPAAYRMIMRLATAIYHMPPRCAHAKGFRNRLEEVAVLIMQDAEERTDTVLATPATAATRVASFVFDGQALKSLHNLDARVGRILEEIDDGMHQMARDPATTGMRTASTSSSFRRSSGGLWSRTGNLSSPPTRTASSGAPLRSTAFGPSPTASASPSAR